MRRLLRQLALGFSRAQQLSGPRRRLYTAVSWLIVAIGCVLIVALMYKTRAAFGLPMGKVPLEGIRLQFLGWIAVTLFSIPVLFYAAMVMVCGAFALFMFLLGRFSLEEARAFALFAQPPERWLDGAA